MGGDDGTPEVAVLDPGVAPDDGVADDGARDGSPGRDGDVGADDGPVDPGVGCDVYRRNDHAAGDVATPPVQVEQPPVGLQQTVRRAAVVQVVDFKGDQAFALFHHPLQGVRQLILVPGPSAGPYQGFQSFHERPRTGETVDPGDREIRHGMIGFLHQPGDPPAFDLDQSVPAQVTGDPLDADGVAARLVGKESEIRKIDDVSQQDQKRLVVHEVPAQVHGVSDPERLALHDVPGFEVVTPVDEPADGVTRWRDHQHDVADTHAGNLVEQVFQHRLAGDGNHGLGGIQREGVQSAAAASDGNDGFHGTSLRVCSLSRRNAPGPKRTVH